MKCIPFALPEAREAAAVKVVKAVKEAPVEISLRVFIKSIRKEIF
jgi:hypothetical protein